MVRCEPPVWNVWNLKDPIEPGSAHAAAFPGSCSVSNQLAVRQVESVSVTGSSIRFRLRPPLSSARNRFFVPFTATGEQPNPMSRSMAPILRSSSANQPLHSGTAGSPNWTLSRWSMISGRVPAYEFLG